MEIRVGKTFRLIRRLGSGSFGEIWTAIDVVSGVMVAVKLEHQKRKTVSLLAEAKLLLELQGAEGVPQVFWYGCEGDYTVLVMELMGPSLEDIMRACKYQLSMATVSMLGTQMLDRLETVHNAGIIHRDIKPQNFLLGIGPTKDILHIIDFGLAKRFKNKFTGTHGPCKEGKSITGTVRYVSQSTHLGVEQSRRDDLESLCYLIIYLMRGILPWQGLRCLGRQDKYERIMDKKMFTPVEVLCKDLPPEISIFLQYTRSLKFTQRPDYSLLRKCLNHMVYYDSRLWSIIYEESDIEIRKEKLHSTYLKLFEFDWNKITHETRVHRTKPKNDSPCNKAVDQHDEDVHDQPNSTECVENHSFVSCSETNTQKKSNSLSSSFTPVEVLDGNKSGETVSTLRSSSTLLLLKDKEQCVFVENGNNNNLQNSSERDVKVDVVDAGVSILNDYYLCTKRPDAEQVAASISFSSLRSINHNSEEHALEKDVASMDLSEEMQV